jgi:hypothetical protein
MIPGWGRLRLFSDGHVIYHVFLASADTGGKMGGTKMGWEGRRVGGKARGKTQGARERCSTTPSVCPPNESREAHRTGCMGERESRLCERTRVQRTTLADCFGLGPRFPAI